MGWKVYGEWLASADIATSPNKRVYAKVKFGSNVILEAMRTWLIFYNDPVFTALTFDIYANDETTGLASTLIASSTTSWEKAQLITLANGVKGMYYKFPKVALQGGTWYHFIPRTTTYTGTAGTHLSWRKAWPDPVYGAPRGYNDLGKASYMMAFIGAEL